MNFKNSIQSQEARYKEYMLDYFISRIIPDKFLMEESKAMVI